MLIEKVNELNKKMGEAFSNVHEVLEVLRALTLAVSQHEDEINESLKEVYGKDLQVMSERIFNIDIQARRLKILAEHVTEHIKTLNI